MSPRARKNPGQGVSRTSDSLDPGAIVKSLYFHHNVKKGAKLDVLDEGLPYSSLPAPLFPQADPDAIVRYPKSDLSSPIGITEG